MKKQKEERTPTDIFEALDEDQKSILVNMVEYAIKEGKLHPNTTFKNDEAELVNYLVLLAFKEGQDMETRRAESSQT